MSHRPLARTSDFVVQGSGDDTLVYDLKTNKAVCLNETAAIVWKLCDGNRTVSAIAVEVEKQLKSRIDEDFVLFALDQLNGDGLLAKGFVENERFSGLTRREAMRKIGFGSMVALPIVSSILAPTAAHAQSGCILPPVGVCLTSGTTAYAHLDAIGRTINFTTYYRR